MKDEYIKYLKASLKQNTFVKLTLGKYRGNEKSLENIYAEPVKINDEVLLSFRFKYKTRDTFKNHDYITAAGQIEKFLGTEFLYGALFTIKNDIIIEYNKKREARLYKKKPTFSQIGIKDHNRIKSRFIESKSRFLNYLGITNKSGEVYAKNYSKFRQIDKFIELVNSLYSESGLDKKERIKITDYGSGKSYLTFALYYYFTRKLNIEAIVTGIEQREDLSERSNRTAVQCGFEGLSFISSTILKYENNPADIVVALHACDTATDDAISKAIASGAEIIILAPCCHKYVRKKIAVPENLKSIFIHGIIEEHISSFVTDGLRALMLEAYGYRTKVIEFISPEHTAKNMMITAVKETTSEVKKAAKFKEIENIKLQFGLKDFYLDTILTQKR